MQNIVYHAISIEKVLEKAQVDSRYGLRPEEAAERLKFFGSNRLAKKEKESFFRKIVEKLKEEPMVALLLVTGVLYALWGELVDAITIIAVIVLLWLVEESNEERAEVAIKSLSKLSEPTALVLRKGQPSEISLEEVVPGDIVLLQAGRRVPADARLLEAYSLAVDESSLTGESHAVEKDASARLPGETALAEQTNMVFSGTLVTRGRGKAVVTATGMQTEIGRLAGLAQSAHAPRTALQRDMDELSKTLVIFALGFSLLVPLLGVLIAHQPLKEMLLTALTLAFATIPEEMPIIITMVLALGSKRLAKQNAIVRRFQAVESLGAVTVIATDKTGTLTENKMEVSWLEREDNLTEVLDIAVLCSSALPEGLDFLGDPLETGLLRFARSRGVEAQDLRARRQLRAEFSFDNTRKRMSVISGGASGDLALVKGAPEAVLSQCTRQLLNGQEVPLNQTERETILQTAAAQAGRGLRVLAMAQRRLPVGNVTQEQAESDLVFTSLIGLSDPVRPQAADAIRQMRAAGIRTLMITGDHPLTARSVAVQVGLDGGQPILTGLDVDAMTDEALQLAVQNTSVFARTTPEHKLRIVRALQALGERVAVTGDGTNDAPALSAADIGVAMGETGSDVAREASGIVLADDNYITIVNAVREGRLIYENLRKGVRYYLACKLALVLVNLLAVLLGAPVPFSPVQIILMELFMDLAASATFVVEPAEMDLLQRQPRDPQARFMDRPMQTGIIGGGLGLFAAVSVAYLWTWFGSQDLALAQTVAFYAWLCGHVLLALNLRSEHQPLTSLGLSSNRLMLLWIGVVGLFLLALNSLMLLQTAIKTVPLSAAQLGLILLLAFLGTFWQEAVKWLRWRGSRRVESLADGQSIQ